MLQLHAQTLARPPEQTRGSSTLLSAANASDKQDAAEEGGRFSAGRLRGPVVCTAKSLNGVFA